MFIYGLYAIESHKYDMETHGDAKPDVSFQRQRSLSIGSESKHLSDFSRHKFQSLDNDYEKNLEKFENLVQKMKQNLDQDKHLKLSEHIWDKNKDNRKCSLSYDSSLNENKKILGAQLGSSPKVESNISRRKKFNQRQFSLDLGTEGCEKIFSRVKRNNSLQRSTIFEDETENESEEDLQQYDSKFTKKWLSKIIDSFKRSHSDV
ncbi:hypothetical protein BpHYR1_037400 [Brachionus plicatilis]|uniref:Uncharacterized protein n=1 Tax=Brachionus plicatilis TaxID=10195 RepID=A0A3M7SPS0_BRAPC|nr:hypothetical protein BpHYR1_037400 [Brachionus plicatilis]